MLDYGPSESLCSRYCGFDSFVRVQSVIRTCLMLCSCSKTQTSTKKIPAGSTVTKQLPVGVHADRLRCSVVGDVVSIAHYKWSAKKLKAAMGGVEVCYCCLLSRHEDPETCCPTPKEPGHERGGKMHVFDPATKEHILKNWKLFEAGWGNAKP